MKVVHLCLGAFYPDHYAYQENMLPKFHKELGCDVEVIASTQSFDQNGRLCYLKDTGTYQNEYGIPVTRLPYKSGNRIWKKLKRYVGTYAAIERAAPDILFIHNCQFMDIRQVVKYVRAHSGATVYVDNHADFSNSAANWLSEHVLHRVIWRWYAHQIEPYTKKFYGVLPARVDFLTDVYGLPEEKCELLVMGADDELVERAERSGARERVRARYGIKEDDFLVITGGKIDQWKTQTLLLMEAVQKVGSSRLKLIVFGSVAPELMDRMKRLADGEKTRYIGWIQSEDSYDYFAAADLAVFPGRHSVLWEQAAGQGLPMLVKDWPGTRHVDLGGNVRFLYQDSAAEIQREIEELLENRSAYQKMKSVAEDRGMQTFSYREIAKRSIYPATPR